MKPITIRKISAFCTRPAGFNLTVVRVDTDEPGLFGLGCATYTYRFSAVADVVEHYLKQLLIGRDVSQIEDIWQMLYVNAYWRAGPVINNAISGIDMALWDILGKRANLPLYALLGGKCREAVPVYRYAECHDLSGLEKQVKHLMEDGARCIRIQRGFTPEETRLLAPEGSQKGFYVDPVRYCRETVEMFAHIRAACGEDVELCHDVHERIPPDKALALAKQLEPYHPLFLEDMVSPDQCEWLRPIAAQTGIPLAQGELCVNPTEWETMVKDRLISYMRTHMSQIGGLTPARKQAAFCEQFGIRMAFHCPPDGSPIGHAVNMHLDLAIHNFGIQEWPGLDNILYEMFPGAPKVKGNYATIGNAPGIGVGFDEKLAKEFPAKNIETPWIEMRLPDGTLQRP